MKTIQTTSRTGPDGVLNLTLPSGMADTKLDVIVILQPLGPNGAGSALDRKEWVRFVEETGGSIQDPTFMRHEQGEYEKRDDWG